MLSRGPEVLIAKDKGFLNPGALGTSSNAKTFLTSLLLRSIGSLENYPSLAFAGSTKLKKTVKAKPRS
jgi:hypothetical protein